jgi:hypothetical protein
MGPRWLGDLLILGTPPRSYDSDSLHVQLWLCTAHSWAGTCIASGRFRAGRTVSCETFAFLPSPATTRCSDIQNNVTQFDNGRLTTDCDNACACHRNAVSFRLVPLFACPMSADACLCGRRGSGGARQRENGGGFYLWAMFLA